MRHLALRILSLLPLFAACTVAAAVAAAPLVRWQDPAEGAFSVYLPSGWQVTGGTVRTTKIEPHYVIRAKAALRCSWTIRASLSIKCRAP